MPNEYRIYEFKKPGFDKRDFMQKAIPIIGILFIIWVFSNGLASFFEPLKMKLILFPLFIMSLVLHEMAHAYMADFLGDPTPRLTGRLSFNPLKHLDIFGTLLFLFCGFGWAKPVMTDASNFKNPNRAMVSVGLAGPLCNFVLAILICIIMKLSISINSYQLPFLNKNLGEIMIYAVYINVLLAVFNLIPIPPLDGSRLIHYLLPNQYKAAYYKLQQYSFIIFILLFVYGSQMIEPIVNSLVYALLKLIVF